MSNQQLNVIKEGPSKEGKRPVASRLTRRKELQAKFERLWLLDPEQFNPLRNCMQKERLDRTWELIHSHLDVKGKRVADIGCAGGIFSRRLRDEGAGVDAIDIAENALKVVKSHDTREMNVIHDAMPETSLQDHAYDLVVCSDLIAELSQDDYRLFFSELARLVKPEGFVIFSSPLDISTQGGVERLVELAQTEFDLIEAKPSYHALSIQLKGILKAPENFVELSKDESSRQKTLSHQKSLQYYWKWINTTVLVNWMWKLITPLSNRLLAYVDQNKTLLLKLEKICETLQHENGISHVILIGKVRPLQQVDPEEIPVTRLGKKEVWE